MNVMDKQKTRVHIRWMIRRDMPEVLAIEQANFLYPWSEEEFLRFLRQRNAIGMVAEHGDKIVGFMCYSLERQQILVPDFAVDPAFCRHGIGTAMIEKLKGKLTEDRRSKIKFLIRESNLSGCLFLKASGFKASEVLRSHFDDSNEDGYQFVYTHKSEPKIAEFLQSPGEIPVFNRKAPRFTV